MWNDRSQHIHYRYESGEVEKVNIGSCLVAYLAAMQPMY